MEREKKKKKSLFKVSFLRTRLVIQTPHTISIISVMLIIIIMQYRVPIFHFLCLRYPIISMVNEERREEKKGGGRINERGKKKKKKTRKKKREKRERVARALSSLSICAKGGTRKRKMAEMGNAGEKKKKKKKKLKEMGETRACKKKINGGTKYTYTARP